MRVYTDFKQAKNEIERDLAELGKQRFAGYQSVDYTDLTPAQMNALVTRELNNYDYRVLKPRIEDLEIPSEEWLKQEWEERVMGIEGDPVNPGFAWVYRRDLWEPLLEDYKDELHPGVFSYTYSERLARYGQVWAAIHALVSLPHSRQAYVSIWDPSDSARLGRRRVPCTLGYQFQVRDGRLNVTYLMRSNDFKTHWANDLALTLRLAQFVLEHVNDRAGMKYGMGHLTHVVGSLHVYQADVQHVF